MIFLGGLGPRAARSAVWEGVQLRGQNADLDGKAYRVPELTENTWSREDAARYCSE